MTDITFTDVEEQKRTYFYPEGNPITFDKVVKVGMRERGSTHRLETADGRKFVVATGWRAIEIEAKEWSF